MIKMIKIIKSCFQLHELIKFLKLLLSDKHFKHSKYLFSEIGCFYYRLDILFNKKYNSINFI